MRRQRLFHARAVGAAIGAQVEEEHVEQRAVGDLAIDAAGFGRRVADRRHLVEGAAGARRQQRHRLLGVAVVLRQILRCRPVVGDLVIVPLEEGRADRVERAAMLVHEVVFPLVAIFGERLGDLALAVDQHLVDPLAAVRQLDLVLHRAVGIDGVARMQEEVGRVLGHRRIGQHARFVDAPALPRRVAGPGEADVALGGGRGAEAADDRLRHGVDVAEIDQRHAVEDVLVGRRDRSAAASPRNRSPAARPAAAASSHWRSSRWSRPRTSRAPAGRHAPRSCRTRYRRRRTGRRG